MQSTPLVPILSHINPVQSPVPILSQINPVHATRSVLLSCTSRSSAYGLSCRIYYQIPHVFCRCHLPPTPILSLSDLSFYIYIRIKIHEVPHYADFCTLLVPLRTYAQTSSLTPFPPANSVQLTTNPMLLLQ